MRKLLYPIPILLLTILLAPQAGKAQVDARATIDSAQVLIGGKRTIRLQVDYAPGIRLLDPVIAPLDTAGSIELLHTSEWDTTRISDKSISVEKEILITAWDSGYFSLKPISVPYRIQDRTDTAYTNALPLEVDLMPQDSAMLMPLKPIIEEPFRTEDLIPYLLGLLATVIILAGIWWWWRRKKRPVEKVAPPPVVIPAHTVALDKFEALKQAQLWQKGQIVQYHTQLTFILREYLENRYGILALESTTREIAGQLKNIVPEDLRQETTRLLNTSDMVKFAKATPPVEVHDQLLTQAVKFIQSTKPASTEASPEQSQ
ncbi:MAG: hypothetical protein H6563_14520 [Lewinellaceae bacterium]|nr:hypothetical protein [Lewinellaceae bacterium]